MEELDDYTLTQNGYELRNGIIFKDDMYLESVTIGGITRLSAGTEEDARWMEERELKLLNVDFKANEFDAADVITQESKAIYKNDIKSYLADPDNVEFTQNQEDPVFQEAFQELNEEAQARGEGVYADSQSMIDAKEAGTIYEDIKTPEEKKRLKELEKEQTAIRNGDKSWSNSLKSTAGGLAISGVGFNGATEGGKWIAGQIISGVSSVIPDTWGMEDEKKVAKFEKNKASIKKIKDPLRKEKIAQMDVTLDDLEQQVEEEAAWRYSEASNSLTGSELVELEREIGFKQGAITKLTQQRNNLLNNVEDKWYDGNIFTERTVKDLSTFILYII